jgi:Na+/proline symporter
MANNPTKTKSDRKADLLSRIVVLFLIAVAFYFQLENNVEKLNSSIVSLSIIILLGLAIAISIGTAVHTFWKYINHDKNT